MTNPRFFCVPANVARLLVCAAAAVSLRSQPPSKENPKTPDQVAAAESADKTIQARTKVLLAEYFERRYTPLGGRLVVADTNLQTPTKVEGWPGRWRMKGTTALQSYRAIDPKREKELWNDPKLNRREIERIIANETFIKSELLTYEVELSKLDTVPEIDVTLR